MRKFTSDDLAVMLDEDLVKLESSIKSQIGRQRKNGDATHGEVDLCYVGRELEVAGTLSTLKAGSLSLPIKGNQGVYLILPEAFTEPTPIKDYNEEKALLERTIKQRVDYEVFSALKEKAEIVDNRGKFY